MSDKLMAELDGAEMVVYDADGFLLAWFGGESTGIHVYDAAGVEVDYFQMGARASGSYTAREAREAMNEHILGADDDDDDDDADEPDEDDVFITDTPRGYSVSYAGKFVGEYSDRDDAERELRAAMDAGNFWPTVWFVSDHGNAAPLELAPTDDDDDDDDDAPAEHDDNADDAPTDDDAQGFGLVQAAAIVAPPSMDHRPVHDPWMTNPSDPDYLAPAARWCIICARPDREHICTTCVRRADDRYDNPAAGEHCADKVHEPFYAAASNHTLTFAPDADPADTAKVAARLAKALKPSCMDCGKNLTAKDLRAGRVCTDHTACRLRRILHGPKCPEPSYGWA